MAYWLFRPFELVNILLQCSIPNSQVNDNDQLVLLFLCVFH